LIFKISSMHAKINAAQLALVMAPLALAQNMTQAPIFFGARMPHGKGF